MIKITEDNYPKIYTLLEIIAHDSGRGCYDIYCIDEKYKEQLPLFESKLQSLTEEELEDLAIGEETDMMDVVEKYGLKDVSDFLNVFFES